MNGLETVVDDGESPVTIKCNVKLSVIGVLCMMNITEGCDDVSNWRSVDGKQQVAGLRRCLRHPTFSPLA